MISMDIPYHPKIKGEIHFEYIYHDQTTHATEHSCPKKTYTTPSYHSKGPLKGQ
jgi:hypothetical protein